MQVQTTQSDSTGKQSGAFRLETARTIAELQPFLGDWNRLALSQPLQIPFLTGGWAVAHLGHLLDEGTEWVCLFALDGDRLVGVLPLEIHTERLTGITAKVVRGLKHSHSYSCDFVTTADRANEIREFLLTSLDSVVPDWDVFIVNRIPEQSPTVPFASRPHRQARVVPRVDGVGAYQATEGSYEDYLKSLSSNFGGNLKKKRKKLQKLSDVRFEISTDPTMLAQFVQVEGSGWKGRAGSSIGSDERLIAFYTEMASNLAHLGILEWHLLWQGDKLIAGNCAVRIGDLVTVMKTGYDEAFADYAPGNMLVDQLASRLFADPSVRAVNWLSDMNWHKNWRAKYWTYYNFAFCRRNLAGTLVFLVGTLRAKLANVSFLRRIKDTLSAKQS